MPKFNDTKIYGDLTVTGITNLNEVGEFTLNEQLTSTLATGAAPFVITSTTLNTNLNADLLDGLHLNVGTRNDEVNKVMRTDASGYANFGWINTTSGNTTGVVSDVYVNTNDGYIRKKTLALFKAELGNMPASSVNLSTISVDTINGDTHGNAILRQLSGGEVAIGSDARQLRLTGNTTRPYYTTSSPTSTEGVQLALLSDIPTTSGSYELTKDKIDTALKGSGHNSIQLGPVASAGGTFSIALGRETSAAQFASVALGFNSSAEGTDSTALGPYASTGTSKNTMQLGSGASLSTLRSRVQLTVTSDIRDKADIEEIPKALDFIKDLNPITYVSNDRENYISEEQKETDTYKDYLMVEDYDRESHSQGTKKGGRRRVGLSAQEVREKLIEHYGSDNYANVVNDNFVEFEERELDVPKDLENKLTMSYETMVPFLIKAIQEQQEQIEELINKLK